MMKVKMRVDMSKSCGTQEDKDELRDYILTLKDVVYRMGRLWKEWELKEKGGVEK